jgi:hypothetical protein
MSCAVTRKRPPERLKPPFHNVVHAQIASGYERIDARAAVTQHTAACDECVGESNTKILIARIFNGEAENPESQYGDRLLTAKGARGQSRQRPEPLV